MAILLVFVAACWMTVAGYSSGKVTVSCKSMLPKHHGHMPSPTPSPYKIIVDKMNFNPGDQIKVTVSAPAPLAEPFKGFLIEARDAANVNGDAAGTFTLLNPSVSQLLNCGPTQGSAVSHTSADSKTEIQAMWNAPKDAPHSVQFLATVLEHYSVYWAQIPGPIVSQSGVAPPSQLPATTSAGTTAPSKLLGPFSSEGCGRNMSCLRDPVGCDPRSDPQCFFLSFTRVGQTVQFQLSGPAEGYVSFALSFDKWMGNDDVYLCVRNGDLVEIHPAYAEGRTHPELEPEGVLGDVEWRLSDGVIQCSFRRSIHIPNNQNRFNLDERFYIFLAHGTADFGVIHRHHRQPLISTKEKVISGMPENLSGSRSPLMIKFHGALMFIAWVTLVSTGTIVARFFKPEWPDRTLFGQKVWFQVHRGLMSLTVLLTCISFILPFIYRWGWSKRAGAHACLGCVVMILTILQPLGAVFRPHLGSPRRCIFNWLHFGGGIIIHIMAVAAVFLGMQQQALLLETPLCMGITAGVFCWGAMAALSLELHQRRLLKRGVMIVGGMNSKQEKMVAAISYHIKVTNGIVPMMDELREGEGGALCASTGVELQNVLFKKVVLAVYISGSLALLITLLSYVHGA